MIDPQLVAWAFKYEEKRKLAEHLQRRLDAAHRMLVKERKENAELKRNGQESGTVNAR